MVFITPPCPPLKRGGGSRGQAIADCAARTTSAYPPWPPFVRGAIACGGERSQTAWREQPLRHPPWPPFVRGAIACGRAIADCVAGTTSAPVGERSQTARREQPLRHPRGPPRKGGDCLRASGRRLRGENNLLAYPPWPPFVRGAIACGRANADCVARTTRLFARQAQSFASPLVGEVRVRWSVHANDYATKPAGSRSPSAR